MRDIVMIGMNTYYNKEHSTTNRNFEILEELKSRSEIGKIIFVDQPPHSLKRAIAYTIKEFPYYRAHFKDLRGINFGLYQIDEKLFVYSSSLSGFGNKGEQLLWKKVHHITQQLALKNPMIWSYNPLFTGYLNEFPSNQVVFDCVDNWQEHTSYTQQQRRLIGEHYKEIGERADTIFTVSRELLSLFPNHKNAHFIPNGVRGFNHVVFTENKTGIRNDSHNADRINVGYVGVIQDRIDERILDEIISHANFRVTMFGPVWNNFNLKKYQHHPFITFPNKLVPHEQLPETLKEMDVMIIPHKVNAFTKSMNPMKLYDYLACGKPIVSTTINDLSGLDHFVKIAQAPTDFPQLIEEAARENSQQLQLERMQAIKTHDWKHRVDDMLSYLPHHSHIS